MRVSAIVSSGSKGGAVVSALASEKCGPGSKRSVDDSRSPTYFATVVDIKPDGLIDTLAKRPLEEGAEALGDTVGE